MHCNRAERKRGRTYDSSATSHASASLRPCARVTVWPPYPLGTPRSRARRPSSRWFPRVAAPRRPGHGTRWQDLNATTWRDWVSEAERSLQWVGERTDTVIAMNIAIIWALSEAISQNRRLAELPPV